MPGADDSAPAQALADTLREAGISAIVYSGTKSLGDQIKEAVRRTTPYFLAYGEEERASGSVKVKHLADSTEEVCEVAGLVEFLT